MVEQVLGAHQHQRLGEGPVHLAPQHVEQLRMMQHSHQIHVNADNNAERAGAHLLQLYLTDKIVACRHPVRGFRAPAPACWR